MTGLLKDNQITLNINPPENPGKHYIIVKENCDIAEAIAIALLTRQHHPEEPVEIWVVNDTLRTVVREALK